MDAVNSIALFIKNIIGTNINTDSPLKIPHFFSAKVSKVEGNKVQHQYGFQDLMKMNFP